MGQSISKQFHSALIFLLAREGRGAQSRLASQQNIDRGYLNAIIKGRKPGAEEVRSKNAAYFDMIYEDMLALGRRILNGKNELAAEGKGEVKLKALILSGNAKTEEGIFESHELQKTVANPASISETILKAIEILESGTPYGDSLRGSIDVLHEAVRTKKENLVLHNQMMAMGSRVVRLEAMVSDSKICIQSTT
jgi:hypothetical protein